MGKPRGRPPSRVGFPASRRRAWLSFRPPRSYGLSTGSHGKPCRQNVLCSIDITIMGYATLGACPVTNIKRQGVENMPTIETALRGGIPLINLDKGTSIPLSFVCELPHKLTPSHIRDGFRKCVVFDHILDVQTLDAYDLVLTYDLSRELVLIITPSISNPGVDTSDFQLCLASVLRALFRACMSSLSLRQFLIILGKERGVSRGVSIARDDHRLQSQVKPDLLIHYWQMLHIFLNQDGDKVAMSTIFGDGHTRGFTAFGQGTRPVDIKGCLHLSKSEGMPVPAKSVGSIGSRLCAVFLVEGGVLSTSFEEVSESGIQVSEGLLEGNAGHFRKPGRLFLLFQFSQHTCQLIVVETLTTLEESIGTRSQCPVIGVATTPKGTSKDVSLFISWVKSIRVCFLLFHALQDSRYVINCQAPNPSPKQGRARISPVLKDGVLRSIFYRSCQFIISSVRPLALAKGIEASPCLGHGEGLLL